MTRFARFLLIATLMISIGGQWMVLQGVAWVGMAVSYSLEEGSVGLGLSKTFDGEHPCELCRIIDRGMSATSEQDEKQNPSNPFEKGGKKWDLFSNPIPTYVFGRHESEACRFEFRSAFCLSRTEQPPVPPPQVA